MGIMCKKVYLGRFGYLVGEKSPGFIALLLILLRYVSIKLSPSAHTIMKEVLM